MQESFFLLIPFRRHSTLEINIRLKYPDLRSSRFSPKPDCRSTDIHPRSTGQSPEFNREFGTYSQGIAVDPPVDRLRTLCMLCMSVDRDGRPTCLFFCCCCCFHLPCLSSSTSLAIFDNTWQSCQFLGNILSFQQL